MPVIFKSIQITEDAVVSVGYDQTTPDRFYLNMVKNGVETRLALTQQALDAITQLYGIWSSELFDLNIRRN